MRCLALLALIMGCAPSRAVTKAGNDTSIAMQHATSAIDSVRQIATAIERHIEQPPQFMPEGQAAPSSPFDAILQATVTMTPDLWAIYRAGKKLVEQLRAMKQKAEVAP